jgi:hypothetical protein
MTYRLPEGFYFFILLLVLVSGERCGEKGKKGIKDTHTHREIRKIERK